MNALPDGRKVKRQRHQLGPTQRSILRMIAGFGERGWSWPLAGGTIWKSRAHDFRVARSLVKRGLLDESGSENNPVFTVTEAGKKQTKIEGPQP